MTKPAFIVDGYTEKLVISSLCPGKPVSRTDLNGKSVTIDAIAKKISSLIRIFNNRYYPIIIVLDREKRHENCDTLRDNLANSLKLEGIVDQDLRIIFADRVFENWIIADWDILGVDAKKPAETDGLKGSTELKKVFGSYSKTTDGVDLFLKCDHKKVYNNSPSFKRFVDSISDIGCSHFIFEKTEPD